MKKYLIMIAAFITIVLFWFCLSKAYFIEDKREVKIIEDKIDKANFDNIDKLMIVAHPDDEVYWGGAHLLKDNYFVVCITCGSDKHRIKSFKKVMKITNDKYIMLNYVDLVNGEKSNWQNEYSAIKKDLELIIKSKNWETIVTHNPKGEYGHIHHIMTNKMVTELANKDSLWYFGKYYARKDLKSIENAKLVDKNLYDIKINKLIVLYPTEKSAENKFKHMFKYENWIFNEDWQ